MTRIEFFDNLATRWDTIVDVQEIGRRLQCGLVNLRLDKAEHVVDIGCGTGTLLGCLIDELGSDGRIDAIDFSAKMIAEAQAKIPDSRVIFHQADVQALPLPDESFDRVFCFSSWPHFTDPTAAIKEIRRILKPWGIFHVWHVDSRETINRIHADAGEPVSGDLLPPASVLARQLEGFGFVTMEVIDNAHEYRVSSKSEKKEITPR